MFEKNNIIRMTILNADKGTRVYKKFDCAQCRASMACAGLGQCRLIGYLKNNNYLKTAGGDVRVNIDNKNADIDVAVSNNEFSKTVAVVNRAIRLRTYRYNSVCHRGRCK